MTDTLATALVSAQKEMPHVDKTAKANYGTYATLDHIIAKTRSVLNKHGLSITQFPEVTELGGPGLRTTITHSSGESVSAVMPLFLVKQDMQSLGSALTYARRYAWAAALGISAEADDDGEQATRPKTSSDGAAEGASTSPSPGAASRSPAPSDTPSEAEPQAAEAGPPADEAVSQADPVAVEPASASDAALSISFTQRARITQLIVEAATANGSTVPKLTKTLTDQYGPFDKLTAQKADELIGKLARWADNAKAAA